MEPQHTVRVPPRCWTPIPGTNLALWWGAEQAITVRRRGGCWDLSPLTRLGRVCAWLALVQRPQLGWWPITPPARRLLARITGRREDRG